MKEQQFFLKLEHTNPLYPHPEETLGSHKGQTAMVIWVGRDKDPKGQK